MPTYNYKCSNCAHELEIFHSISEDPKTYCPNCKTDNLQRIISKSVGISFKGSGFYINDSTKPSK